MMSNANSDLLNSFDGQLHTMVQAAYGSEVELPPLQENFLRQQGTLEDAADMLITSGLLDTQLTQLGDKEFINTITENFARGLVSEDRQAITKQYFYDRLQEDGTSQADIMVEMTHALMRSEDAQWSKATASVKADIETTIDTHLVRDMVQTGEEVYGSLSHDTFVFTGEELKTSITNFNTGADALDFSAATSEETLTVLTTGGDAIISGTQFLFLDASENANAADSLENAAQALNNATSDLSALETTSYVAIVDDNSTSIYMLTSPEGAQLETGDLTLVGTIDAQLTENNIALV